MNQLVDGEWITDAGEYADDDGAFERGESTFRDRIEDDPDARFPAESGRYHLYASYACPWAHRVLAIRALKGLEEAIGLSVVDPFRAADGWQFTPEREGSTPDRIHGVDYLRELYVRADPEATCRVTVPVLWDTERDTIVNNESRELLRTLDTEFEAHATREADLYPEGYREEIDEVIDAIYEPINNGVYRAGFATKQAPYDEAIDDLFSALSHWESVLADQRYLAGDRLTEADICLFTTLVRFDSVYHTHFMCNVNRIVDYPNLWNYLKELYQLPGIAETVEMDHIKEHYYTTHPDVNPSRIIARGPDLDFEGEHDRDRFD